LRCPRWFLWRRLVLAPFSGTLFPRPCKNQHAQLANLLTLWLTKTMLLNLSVNGIDESSAPMFYVSKQRGNCRKAYLRNVATTLE
jgi:hypothetical protein